MSSAPRTLGAGDSLDHYIDLCFRARPDGSVLFFRWRYGRGYVIDSADKHEQVRQCVRTWMRLVLLPMPGIALHAVLGVPRVSGLVIGAALALYTLVHQVGYRVALRAITRDLPRTTQSPGAGERPGLRQSFRLTAQASEAHIGTGQLWTGLVLEILVAVPGLVALLFSGFRLSPCVLFLLSALAAFWHAHLLNIAREDRSRVSMPARGDADYAAHGGVSGHGVINASISRTTSSRSVRSSVGDWTPEGEPTSLPSDSMPFSSPRREGGESHDDSGGSFR